MPCRVGALLLRRPSRDQPPSHQCRQGMLRLAVGSMRTETGGRVCPRAQFFLFDVNQQPRNSPPGPTQQHWFPPSAGSRHSPPDPKHMSSQYSINGVVVSPPSPHPTHSFNHPPTTPQRTFTSPEKHFTFAHPIVMAADSLHGSLRLKATRPPVWSSLKQQQAMVLRLVGAAWLPRTCCAGPSGCKDTPGEGTSFCPAPALSPFWPGGRALCTTQKHLMLKQHILNT